MSVSPHQHEAEAVPDAPAMLAELPPADTERWVARRKAQVVAAVQAGLITLDEALDRYRLSLEEYTGWQRAFYRHGLRGLQINHSQFLKLADRRRRPGSEAVRWSNRHA